MKTTATYWIAKSSVLQNEWLAKTPGKNQQLLREYSGQLEVDERSSSVTLVIIWAAPWNGTNAVGDYLHSDNTAPLSLQWMKKGMKSILSDWILWNKWIFSFLIFFNETYSSMIYCCISLVANFKIRTDDYDSSFYFLFSSFKAWDFLFPSVENVSRI